MKGGGIGESVRQQVMKGLSNAFFGVLMLGVLVFTVMSIRSQRPDPWLEPGQALTHLLLDSVVPNATFQVDDSMLHTGEDFSLSVVDNATSTGTGTGSDMDGPAITEAPVSVIAEQEGMVGCKWNESKAINCSDPGVLAAIVRFNLHHFSDLNFYSYQTPVRGLEENECDVAWKFRAKKEKSWRMYRDFRRFALIVDEACNLSVASALGWHSGKNVKRVGGRKGSASGGTRKSRPTTPVHVAAEKNVTVMEEVDVIEDSVPAVALLAEVSAFKQQKYLFYGRGGDHCKKMNQYLWSFLCALGEAQYLNRTLVVDLNLCLSSSNNPGHGDEDGKDFRFYFDFVHLKVAAAVIEQNQFLEEWASWNQKHPGDEASYREISGNAVTPMQLESEGSTILMRKFDLPEPENYWYRVCEGETERAVQRPWHLLWKSKRVMDVVNAICGQMEWDFDTVHIVRGDKALNKHLWPNLDADTSLHTLLPKLTQQAHLNTSRFLYIATNEREAGYFAGLKEVFKHASTLDDFGALWAKHSTWYNQTLALTDGKVAVEFDAYMRAEVDTEVSLRAKRKIETFGFLTQDCKDGVNTC